jgi:hypothetical protein
MGWYLLYALSTFFSGITMSQGNYLLPFIITCVVYFIAAVAYTSSSCASSGLCK